MEGFGQFNLEWESSEVNGNQRAREEAVGTGDNTNEILEVASSDAQEIPHGSSSSAQRGQKQRHSPYQIQELEKFFRENPNPNERERLELGRKLNLEPNQVKFWFQNKRSQLKTQMDRHDNIILKRENEQLRLENRVLKDELEKKVCKNCTDLRIEIARLREELNRTTRPSSSLPGGGGLNPIETGLQMGIADNNLVSNDPPLVPASRESTVMAAGRYLELASRAMDELMKLVQVNASLWYPNMETGGENLNLDEYVRSFPPLLGAKPLGFLSEASRATGVVSLRSLDLVEALLDADRWREMFVGIIGSSATMEVISDGTGGSRNGVLQLMQAEIQVISPSVSARVVKFIRFIRQHAEGVWAVVDLSVDAAGREGLMMCRRLPSGCIMRDMPNGFTTVTWVEHTEYDERPVHNQYRQLLSSGLGFGAQRWICALLRHCGWLRAMSLPTANYQLDQTTRTCLRGLARHMTSTFCSGVCLTGGQRWNLVSNSPRIMTRRSMNGPGEPSATILSASSSVWIPSTHRRLFDLLLKRDLRSIWDVLCHGNATGNLAHFPMSNDDDNPNSISLLSFDTTEQNPIVVLQETASDMTGSLIVYAPMDLQTLSALMNNRGTSCASLLPSGLYIVPGSGELGALGGERGSMVTVGFQMLLQDLVTPNLITMDTISTVNDLVSRTVMGIKEIVLSTRQGG